MPTFPGRFASIPLCGAALLLCSLPGGTTGPPLAPAPAAPAPAQRRRHWPASGGSTLCPIAAHRVGSAARVPPCGFAALPRAAGAPKPRGGRPDSTPRATRASRSRVARGASGAPAGARRATRQRRVRPWIECVIGVADEEPYVEHMARSRICLHPPPGRGWGGQQSQWQKYGWQLGRNGVHGVHTVVNGVAWMCVEFPWWYTVVCHVCPRCPQWRTGSMVSTVLHGFPRGSAGVHGVPRCSTGVHGCLRVATVFHGCSRCSTDVHGCMGCYTVSMVGHSWCMGIVCGERRLC